MKIDRSIPIYKQTVATLQTAGITGQSIVELSLDIDKNEVGLDLVDKRKGQIIVIKSKPSQLTSIMKKVSAIADSLDQISAKFNKMLSPQNLNKFNEFTDSINILLYNLSNSSIYFNKTLMNFNDTMTESQETITRLNDIMRLLQYDPSIIVRGVEHDNYKKY
jgi:phospholipid/cholesterol/gamma-HCH transport system substrate-binding protein